MTKYSSKELDNVYHSLASATRRKILTRLCKGSFTISELAKPFDMSFAAVSKHIKKLEECGLITKTRENATFRCDINLTPIASAAALIHFFEAHHASTQAETVAEKPAEVVTA